MNQASKAELRYIAITQQIPGVVGDMARTLYSPANALRVLKSQFNLLSQTIGALVNVVVYKFIPVMQAIVQAIISVANAISVLLTGKSLADWDKESFSMSSNLGAAAGSAGDVADETGTAAGNLKDAADNAKKAKQYMMGWDELNVIDTTSAAAAGSGGGGAGGIGGGGGLGLDLSSLWTEDMLDGINEQTDELVGKLRAMLPIVATIGTMFAGWKIGQGLLSAFNSLTAAAKSLTSYLAANGIASTIGPWKLLASAVLGAAGAFLYIKGVYDDLLNGISWGSLLEKIAGVAAGFLAIDMIFKNSPLGTTYKSLLLVASGVGMLATAFREIINGDASAATFAQAIAGIGLAAVGVGLKFGALPGIITAVLGGIALAATTVYMHWDEIVNFMENTDFSGLVSAGGEAVANFIDGLNDALPGLIDTGSSMLVSLMDGAATIIPQLIPMATAAVVTFINGISQNLTNVITSGTTLIASVITGIVSALTKIIPAVAQLIATFVTAVISSLPQIIAAGVKILVAVIDGISQALPQLLIAALQILGAVASGIISNLGTLLESAGLIVVTIEQGILSLIASLFKAGVSLVTEVGNGISDTLDKIEQAAENIVQGLINGIKNKARKVLDAGKELGKTLLNGVKNTLGIASPAKELIACGEYSGQGLINGFVGMTSSVMDASKSLATTMLTSFQSMFDMTDSEDDQGEFLTYGDTMMMSLKDGLQNSAPQVYSTLQQISETIKKIMSDLVTTTQAQARQIIAAAQAAREAASSISVSSVNSRTSSVKLRAAGGTVPSGELFMAREAGPELVGSIGNTTAVMNNDQIVSAVSSGVAKAVAAVMGGQSGGEQKVEVYLDGEKIYANQKKIARSKGREFDMGAFAR